MNKKVIYLIIAIILFTVFILNFSNIFSNFRFGYVIDCQIFHKNCYYNKLRGAVGICDELGSCPTIDNPLGLAPFRIGLMGGDSGDITVAFMNILNKTVDCNLLICESGSECTSGNGLCEGDSCGIPIVYNTTTINIEQDRIVSWIVTIRPESKAAAKNLSYTAKMHCTDKSVPQATEATFTKDFLVTIR